MLKTPLKFIITIVLTLGLSMSFQSLLASWTAPTVNPPGDNISEPINVGSVPQSKSGLLSLTNGLSVSGNIILDGNLTLGGVNRTILTSNGTATFGSTNSHTFLKSAATGNIYLQTGTINRLTVLAGGNVGIGTIIPSQRLDVNGNINLSGANRTILANGGPATFGSTNSHLYLRSANISSNIYLQTGTTNNRLTVLGNGDVGIGTDSPTEKLQVNGRIYSASGGFKFPDGTVQTTAAGSASGELKNCQWTVVSHYSGDQLRTCAVFGPRYLMVGEDHIKDNGYIRYNRLYCCELP